MLKIINLSKIYKRGEIKVNALNNLTANFRAGEISLIMGPSGCGKTTLLNILAGIIDNSSGIVFLNEKEIFKLSEKEWDDYRLNSLGYIAQFFNLIPELTAEENIAFPLKMKMKKREEIKDIVKKYLELVGLYDRRHHYPSELSGGEQQRIAIAMALAKDPEVILCDEPTGELDTSSKKEIMRLFRQIIKKFPEKIIIIVSHDPNMQYIADRVFHIKDGQISYIETPEFDEKDNFQLYLEDKIEKSYGNDEIKHEIQETIYFLTNKLKKIK
ncbi:ABC transporter ATP-binding protein [Candidatus Harpocratesius sp.]